MQLYFLSFCVSSLLYLEVVVKLFDYFWKPKSMFSKFCVNCLLMYYFVYCINSALKDVSGAVNAYARWWPCTCLKCGSGLRRLEKTLDFLRCIHIIDLVLKYGSEINEGNWLQLLFYFIVLIGIVAFVIGMSFFSAVFPFLDGNFLVLHFDGNVCKWIPKVIWPGLKLIFFSSEFFKRFSRWNPYFRKVLHFLSFLFVIMGLWVFAWTW